jgi:hypothetical protein
MKVKLELTPKEARALDCLIGNSYPDLRDLFDGDPAGKAAATRANKKFEEACREASIWSEDE